MDLPARHLKTLSASWLSTNFRISSRTASSLEHDVGQRAWREMSRGRFEKSFFFRKLVSAALFFSFKNVNNHNSDRGKAEFHPQPHRYDRSEQCKLYDDSSSCRNLQLRYGWPDLVLDCPGCTIARLSLRKQKDALVCINTSRYWMGLSILDRLFAACRSIIGQSFWRCPSDDDRFIGHVYSLLHRQLCRAFTLCRFRLLASRLENHLLDHVQFDFFCHPHPSGLR